MEAKDTAGNQTKWIHRFGQTVSDLQEDDALVDEGFGLGQTITDIVTARAYTNEFEATVMLPIALANYFDGDGMPILKLIIGTKSRDILLAAITTGDVCENFKTLILGIDALCESAGVENAIRIDLRRGDIFVLEVMLAADKEDKGLMVYKRPLPYTIMNPICELIRDKFEEKPTEKVTPNETLLDALTGIATDPETDNEIALRLTAILSRFQDGEAPEIPKGTGKLIADLIESKEMPEAISDALFDAAEDLMNGLNRNREMTLAWTRLYLDKALQENREKR
jgi:hypothetical protein